MGDNGFTLLVSPLLFGFVYFISRKTISSAKGSSTVLQGISCVLFVKLSGRIYILSYSIILEICFGTSILSKY